MNMKKRRGIESVAPMNFLFWYPPAETKIPLKAMMKCLKDSSIGAEQIIRQTTGSNNIIFGPSGRALLYHLLKALNLKQPDQRDEVLLPGYTCYSVAAAAVKAGLKIRFYDLDPKDLNPVTHSLEKNCTKRTLAVLSQHLFGIPTDMRDIEKIAAEKGAYHIEDAAQAFGGSHKGRPLGTGADYGLFSFGRGKPLPVGAGGALISKKHNLDILRPLIKTGAGWKGLARNMLTQIAANPCVYGITESLPLGLGKTIFEPNFKVEKTQHLNRQLFCNMIENIEKFNSHRQTVAAIYENGLPVENQVTVPEGSMPVYPRFPLIAKIGPVPLELLRLGVRRLYPQALNQEPQIKAYSVNPEERLDGAETLAKLLVTLPTHHSISENVAVMVVERMKIWLTAS